MCLLILARVTSLVIIHLDGIVYANIYSSKEEEKRNQNEQRPSDTNKPFTRIIISVESYYFDNHCCLLLSPLQHLPPPHSTFSFIVSTPLPAAPIPCLDVVAAVGFLFTIETVLLSEPIEVNSMMIQIMMMACGL